MRLQLDGPKRITLFKILPENVGSLKQSLRTKKLRNRLLSDEFKEAIGWEEQMGQVQFDPTALTSHPAEEFEFSETDQEIIAWGFLHDQEEGDVSTDDSYASLLETFWDKIEELNHDENKN